MSYDPKKNVYKVIVTKDGIRHSGKTHKTIEEAVEAARKLRAKLFTRHNEDRHPLVAPEVGPSSTLKKF